MPSDPVHSSSDEDTSTDQQSSVRRQIRRIDSLAQQRNSSWRSSAFRPPQQRSAEDREIHTLPSQPQQQLRVTDSGFSSTLQGVPLSMQRDFQIALQSGRIDVALSALSDVLDPRYAQRNASNQELIQQLFNRFFPPAGLGSPSQSSHQLPTEPIAPIPNPVQLQPPGQDDEPAIPLRRTPSEQNITFSSSYIQRVTDYNFGAILNSVINRSENPMQPQALPSDPTAIDRPRSRIDPLPSTTTRNSTVLASTPSRNSTISRHDRQVYELVMRQFVANPRNQPITSRDPAVQADVDKTVPLLREVMGGLRDDHRRRSEGNWQEKLYAEMMSQNPPNKAVARSLPRKRSANTKESCQNPEKRVCVIAERFQRAEPTERDDVASSDDDEDEEKKKRK